MRRIKELAFAGGIALAVALPVGGVADARAETLRALVEGLVNDHNLIDAARADLRAATENVRVAYGSWYPTLDVTANTGYEQQLKPPASEDTRLPFKEFDAVVTQKLWDFGATTSAVRSARLTKAQASAALSAQRQALALRGVTAYLNVLRASKIAEFALRSEDNIKKQTQLEDARVQRGAGFATDVLQSKQLLAQAEARRFEAQGNLQIAINEFRIVFGIVPTSLSDFEKPILPVDLLPPTLEGAVEVAMSKNPVLEATQLGTEVTRESIKAAQATGFFPTLNGVVSWKAKDNVGGTAGTQYETLTKVEMNLPFNLGMTALNSVRAAQGAYDAVNSRFADARDAIEQQVRNGWDQLRIQRERANSLLNAANIAAEFLELARKERQLGNRSLLDVLSGETALINASSDATSADTDVAIAVFALLNAMGILDVDAIRDGGAPG